MNEYKYAVILEIHIPGPNNQPLRRDELIYATTIEQAHDFANQLAQQGGRNIYIKELEKVDES
mgnify:FL=1